MADRVKILCVPNSHTYTYRTSLIIVVINNDSFLRVKGQLLLINVLYLKKDGFTLMFLGMNLLRASMKRGHSNR